MPFGIYADSVPPSPGNPISVGTTGGATTADYGDCGSSGSGRNYSINYEIGRTPNTPNSSFSTLLNASTLMIPQPYASLAVARSTVGYLGGVGVYMSNWYNKRGRTVGFNFSVGFTGTSYSKYNVDLCTGGASGSVSAGPYQTGHAPETFTINVAGAVASGVGGASVTQGGRCASAPVNWSVTNNSTNCTHTGSNAASWVYTDTSKWPA